MWQTVASPTYQIFISCWELGTDTKGTRAAVSSVLVFPAMLQHLIGCITLFSVHTWTEMAARCPGGRTTVAALPLPSPGGPQAERHPGPIKSRPLSIKPSGQTSQNAPGAEPCECSQDWLPSPTAELNFPNILNSSLSAKRLYTSSAFHSVYNLVPLNWIDNLAEPQPEIETVSLSAQIFSARPTQPEISKLRKPTFGQACS